MRSMIPFLLGLLVVAAVVRVDFVFAVFYFILALFVLTRVWQSRMFHPVHVDRRFLERAFHGEQVVVEVTIDNRGWLPIPWVELHEILPAQLATPSFHRQVISLGSHERRYLRYTLQGRRRGYYTIGPLKLTSSSLFGLHSPVSAQFQPGHLVVYPRVLPLERLGLPTRSPLVALPARTPLFEDPSCVIGARDYQPGDSPRHIHWTASAGSGRLLVKRYRPSISRETLICLDMDRDGYEGEYRFGAPELAIVAAASLARHVAAVERLPVGLATEAHDPSSAAPASFFLPPRPGWGQLMSVLEVLARIDTAAVAALPQWLPGQAARVSWGATLTVVTGRESDPLYEALVTLRRAGFAVVLILIHPTPASPGYRERAAQLRVPVYRVWRELDVMGGWGDFH